jgi:SAM-dependent methyltransferase
VAPPEDPYYRRDLALAHHLGFGFHAQACAPGILSLLEPVLAGGGVVLELGCGSGLLTRELTAAGHHVIATDASPAMLDLARSYAPAADVRILMLPGDPLPAADAVVSVGHVLSSVSSVGITGRRRTCGDSVGLWRLPQEARSASPPHLGTPAVEAPTVTNGNQRFDCS